MKKGVFQQWPVAGWNIADVVHGLNYWLDLVNLVGLVDLWEGYSDAGGEGEPGWE
jgi:hypothetical protein